MRRIKTSLAAKVFLWVACALILCSLLIYGIVMMVIPRQYTALANDRISRQMNSLIDSLDRAAYETAREKIYRFCAQNHASAMLTTGEETAVFGQDDAMETAENTYSISAVVQFSDLPDSSLLTVLAPASTAEEITRTFLQMLPYVTMLILFISALSAWLCSRRIVEPVLEISRISQRMAQMDMTWRCETERTDELGMLAASLNTLSVRLTEAMEKLETANAKLREEIAASRTLEKQRRDFFAAASHELKTPVTILKGQIESMLLGIGDYQNHEKYLPQALAAVERMENLIWEILAAAKMESGVPASAFSQEPLAPVLGSCIAEIEPLAAQKQIVINAEQIDEAVCIHINRQLFQKAVSGILSNAVRYSPEGQHITVTLTDSTLTVINTGVTISEADLPSLFAPFYRAEKSRSRENGGSGLGLYLVKMILELHKLPFRLENAGNAVRFTVFLNQTKTEAKP